MHVLTKNSLNSSDLEPNIFDKIQNEAKKMRASMKHSKNTEKRPTRVRSKSIDLKSRKTLR